MTSSDRVTFNLTGTNFHISSKTYQQLKELSDKSKFLIEEAQKCSGSKSEIFLEREPACFAALLLYCRQGELHLPTVVCPQVFKDEMHCWGVELSQLSNCCYNTMVSFLDDRSIVDKFEQGFSHMKKEPGHPLPVTTYQSIRVRVWSVLDKPSSSHLAKAYFIVFLVFLTLSLFSMIVSTHPDFLRQMDMDEWKEALGDSYKDHAKFLRQRLGYNDDQYSAPPQRQKISKRSLGQMMILAPENLQGVQPERMNWPEGSLGMGGISGEEVLPKVNPEIGGNTMIWTEPKHYAAGDGTQKSNENVRDDGGSAAEIFKETPASDFHPVHPQTHPKFPSYRDSDTKEAMIVGQKDTNLKHPRHKIRTMASDETDSSVMNQQQQRTQLTDVRKDMETAAKTASDRLSHVNPNSDQNKDIDSDLSRFRRAAPPKQLTTQSSSGSPNRDTTEAPITGNQTNGTDEQKKNESKETDFNEYDKYRARLDFLNYLDYTCLIFFTIDFILRLFFCPKLTRFVRNFLNISDFIALLAGYIMVLVELLLPEEKYSQSHLDLVECLFIFRFVRFFRPLRDVIGFKVLVHSVKASTYELLLLVMFLSSGVIVFSTLVYWCERSNMQSIPDAFWWAIVTMTTVGYGDMVPVTFLGKLVGSLCALSGVVLIAITIPVLVNNFLLFYGYAKVIVARQTEAKGREVREKWQHAAHGLLGRPGSGINRVFVQPIPDPLADVILAKDASKAKVKVTCPPFEEKKDSHG